MASLRGYRVQCFPGHKKTVNHVAWSASGERLASASSDNGGRVWALKSGGLTSVLELNGHTKSVTYLSWDPTQEFNLATCSNDKTVRLWDTRAAQMTAKLDTKGENISLTYTRDGSMLLVGNKKDHVSWIDVRMLKYVFEKSFPSETNEIAFDTTGELFFATTGLGTVDVYHGAPTKATFKRAFSLPAHAASCYSISFAPDGRHFAVGSADTLVSVWDRNEFVCLRTVTRFKAPARTTSFSHDSALLASGGEDGVVDVASVEDGTQFASFRAQAAINCVSWHPSSLLLAYAAERNDSNRQHDPGAVYLFGP